MNVFGVGSRASGLGGAYTAVSDDFSATFYNPGALVQVERSHVGLAFYSASTNLRFDSENPAAQNDKMDVKRPEGFLLGGTNSLFTYDLVKAAFGFTVNLPTSGIILVEMPERSAPHFPRYLNNNRIFAGLALAAKFGRWFSVGAAIHQFAEFGGPISATVPIRTYVKQPDSPHFNRVADDNFRIDLNYAIAPAFGVLMFPTEQLRLALAFRDDISLGVDSPVVTDVGLTGPTVVSLPVKGRTFYEPKQVVGGAAYDSGRWLLSADLSMYQYSEYPPTILPLQDLDVEGQETIAALFVTGVAVDYGFKDTFVPRVGVEYRPHPDWAIRGGYGFEPSPVPPQSGEINVLWPDEHVISTGLGIRSGEVLGPGKSFRLDLHTQLRYLPAESSTKSEDQLRASSSALKALAMEEKEPTEEFVQKVLLSNPGYPSFTAKGTILAGGITLSLFY
ncbi:MAG: TonB-dependent receptor [Nitrospirae bacterium]|nr:TonB-dependent receptor [Nitrospirota bacterium]